MSTLKFDGTFEGLLTSVFDTYFYHYTVESVIREGQMVPLFSDEPVVIITDETKAQRVFNALRRKISKGALGALTVSFLSESPEMDTVTFRYIAKMIDAKVSRETDFADSDIAMVTDMARKVRYEAHRVLQFMRFQKTRDGIYFGVMAPIYDVMSLAVNHFTDRFSDQRFVIYDRRRNYGYFHDGKEVKRVEMDASLPHIATGRLGEDLMDEDERLYQQMWRTYFDAIAIKERLNPRKQRQDMPVRFWQYMTEVQ